MQVLLKQRLNRYECFFQWGEKRGHHQKIEVLAPIITNGILEHFLSGINKYDDKSYGASILSALQSSIYG